MIHKGKKPSVALIFEQVVLYLKNQRKSKKEKQNQKTIMNRDFPKYINIILDIGA